MVSPSVRFVLFLCLTICFSLSEPLYSQNRDAGLWISANFEAKLVKKVSLSLSQELRFNQNISELGVAFTDVGIDYKLNKHFQFAADYRFIQRRRVDDYYSFRHRFYVDIKYSKKLKPFELSLRSRFQDQLSDIGRSADGGVPEYYLRNKISLKWDNQSALSPYISIELFTPLNSPETVAFNDIRSTAGCEYSISKHHKLDLFYMIQKEINTSDPLTDFVLGLGYYYKL